MLNYKFMYYKFYISFLKIGKGDNPEFKALIFFTFWIFLYILNIYGIIVYYFDNIHVPGWIGGALGLLLLICEIKSI